MYLNCGRDYGQLHVRIMKEDNVQLPEWKGKNLDIMTFWVEKVERFKKSENDGQKRKLNLLEGDNNQLKSCKERKIEAYIKEKREHIDNCPRTFLLLIN